MCFITHFNRISCITQVFITHVHRTVFYAFLPLRECCVPESMTHCRSLMNALSLFITNAYDILLFVFNRISHSCIMSRLLLTLLSLIALINAHLIDALSDLFHQNYRRQMFHLACRHEERDLEDL